VQERLRAEGGGTSESGLGGYRAEGGSIEATVRFGVSCFERFLRVPGIESNVVGKGCCRCLISDMACCVEPPCPRALCNQICATSKCTLLV
jgi:hypothetical protein